LEITVRLEAVKNESSFTVLLMLSADQSKHPHIKVLHYCENKYHFHLKIYIFYETNDMNYAEKIFYQKLLCTATVDHKEKL